MAVQRKKQYKPVIKDTFCMNHGCELPVDEFNFFGDIGGQYLKWGYLPYCKACCDEIANDYLRKTKSIEAAIYYTCAMCDVPFMKKVYERTENYINNLKTKNLKPFSYYWNQLNLESKTKGWKAKCFADSDVALGDIKKLQKSDAALKQEMERLELDWGKQEVLDDYSFLELKFETYAEGLTLTPSLEQTIRFLCLAELEVRKIKDAGGDSKNAETKVMGYYKTLGFDKFKNDKNMSDDEKFIEARIAIIERDRPAQKYEDKKLYADWCGFEKYGNDHIYRPLKNLLLGQKEYHITKDEK